MKARLAVIVAALACLPMAGAPALAQETPQNTTAPAQNGVVGNPQLKDFTLNGTVTHAAPAQPAPQTNVQSRPTVPGPAPARTATRSAPAPDLVATTRNAVPSVSRPVAREPTEAVDLSQTTPVSEAAPPTIETGGPVGDPGVAPPPIETGSTGSSGSIPMLPWIIAALALAGAAGWFFIRRRPRESLAGAGDIDLFERAPSPVPEPQAKVPPAPEPAGPPAQPQPIFTGVVSTRLRPWLEIEFKPDRGVVDDQKAAIAFEVSVYNSGNMPARDVLLEAALFNAGPAQDQQIQLFFDNPVAKGDRIPVIPPMERVSVNTAVFLAKDQVVPIEIEGRALFVPMVAFNALYSWGSTKGQTSTSYLVGKETNGEKLAPFRLDLGPRIFRGLAARQHEVGLRK